MHVISRSRHSARWMAGCLILLGLLLAVSGVIEHHAAASEQQIITYRASAENFPNPERGVYIQRSPIWRNGERIPLTRSDLLRARSQGMAMVRTYYLLEPYRNQSLPQSVIDYLQADFATAREAGVKIVLRFAYNFGIGEPDAPLERVLQHIDQVTPVIRSNTDVIAFKAQPYIGCANALEVLLNLPDPAPTLNTRPEYGIRLANEGMWEPSTGYNRLLATVTVRNGVL
ncbi:MAG: DUF4874 domain-containing protein, partial [Roseiflexaceae bacterium]|nr:DUF4874 domain-containing protein [Roseiflexaceae bacterium]